LVEKERKLTGEGGACWARTRKEEEKRREEEEEEEEEEDCLKRKKKKGHVCLRCATREAHPNPNPSRNHNHNHQEKNQKNPHCVTSFIDIFNHGADEVMMFTFSS